PPRPPRFPYTTLFRSEELPHPAAAQRGPYTDRHALTQFELRDRLTSPADLWLLPRDRGKIPDRAVDQLAVTRGISESHVQYDLRSEEHTSELQSRFDL